VSSALFFVVYGFFTMYLDVVTRIQRDGRIAPLRSHTILMLWIERGYDGYLRVIDHSEFYFVSHGLWLADNVCECSFMNQERREDCACAFSCNLNSFA
jgi:hypothetical protein